MTDRAVLALTEAGADLAERIAAELPADLYLPARLAESRQARAFDSLGQAAAKAFSVYSGLIFVAATGIVVRSIGPLLRGKDRDPAVVVLDQTGRFAISLLSGHLGGANELAAEIGRLIGAQPVITTATDTAGLTAVDVLAARRDMTIANLPALRAVNMALLEGRPLQVLDTEDRLGLRADPPPGYRPIFLEALEQWQAGLPGLFVTWHQGAPPDPATCLLLHPRVLIAGLGCHRGTPASEILQLLESIFREHRLSFSSIACLCSTSKRAQEKGLAEAALALNVPFECLDHQEFGLVQVPHPSDMVKKHLGVDSVCEAAALIRSGNGRLLVPKTKGRRATAAVALAG